MRRLISTALVAAVMAAVAVAGASAGASRRPLDVFILAGQSNATGHGEPVPAHERTDARILDLLHPDGARPAVDSLWGMGYRQPGVGLGRFSAEYVIHHAQVRVGLVDCAVGGSPLSDWLPGSDPQHLPPFDECITFTRLVISRHPAARLAGVTFSQGETDSERRFAVFVRAFRRDLDAPKLPIVMQETVDLAKEGIALPYMGVVRQQQEIAASSIPEVTLVSAAPPAHRRALHHRRLLDARRPHGQGVARRGFRLSCLGESRFDGA